MKDCITVEEYLTQTQTSPPTGILLEAEKNTCAEELARKLFLRKNWITAACASWEEAAALPQSLVRRSVFACGLRDHFEGGALIDLRWCSGNPSGGQLNKLEQFLLELRADLHPLILAAPGTSHGIWEQLSALQLQPLTIGQETTRPRNRRIGFEREYDI